MQTNTLSVPAGVDAPVPVPTPDQRAWMELGFGLFVHFGINSYYDVEWSDGTLDPARYNPTELDPDQWCRAAKAAGMKFLVFVTKHCDGFCNWPTAHTNYSVKATPYGGDVLRKVAEACARHGLKLGLYYSLWDRNHPQFQNDASYADYVKAQLSELLTGYGPVCEIWFDAMWEKCAIDWEGKESAAQLQERWRSEGRRRWRMDDIYAHVKSLQPWCIVLNNTTTVYRGVPIWPVDARTSEQGQALEDDRKVWPDDSGEARYLPVQVERTLSKKGPPGMFEHGAWFWHPWDDSESTVEELRECLERCRRNDAVLLLNSGIMANGRMRPQDERVLHALGAGA